MNVRSLPELQQDCLVLLAGYDECDARFVAEMLNRDAKAIGSALGRLKKRGLASITLDERERTEYGFKPHRLWKAILDGVEEGALVGEFFARHGCPEGGAS